MTRDRMARWTGWTLLLALLLTQRPASGDEPRLADYFGFLPVEVYKLDSRIGGLLARDLDGDKTEDILVINNARSRIDLLLSSKRPDDETPAFLKSDVNEIENDKRMRVVNIPVTKEVVSLQTGDFNGDGKLDLAYYGSPAELVILYNDGSGRFDNGRARRVNCGEAVGSNSALTVADLDGDGDDDLALLGPNEIILIHQLEGGKLSEPERVPHTSSNPGIFKAVDIDGDGGPDLVILDGGSDDPIRIRFSVKGGKLGPEQRFKVESPRALAFGLMDDKPGAEILTIEDQSGRARVLTLDVDEGEDSVQRGRLIVYPLPAGNERGRSLAIGDLDGDAKLDVVVTDPANAQFLVYQQAEGVGLGSARTFPGLVGGKTVKIAETDGKPGAEVFVLSEQEKQIGVSQFVEGRLTFPSALPLVGEPVALDLADLNGDKTPEVVYVSRARVNNSDEFSVRAMVREKSGAFVPFAWGGVNAVPLKGLPGVPPALRVLDVNRDGQADLLVFNSYGPPNLLLGKEGAAPAEAGGALGPIAGVAPAGLTLGELDGPVLLVAQNTFARNLLLEPSGKWRVLDQYNTGRGSAQVVGASALDTTGDGVKDVVLLDRSSKSLVFLERQESVYRPVGTLHVGPIDFQGMHVGDFDGDGREDLLIAGTDRFDVVLTGKQGQKLRTIASHESNRTDARLSDLIVGDLNGDKHPDIVLTDTAEHFVEIVTFSGKNELNRALAFRVFESKSFRGGLSASEPRDLTLGDVNGDGLADLILIAHDRILVFRQDPGPKPKPSPNP